MGLKVLDPKEVTMNEINPMRSSSINMEPSNPHQEPCLSRSTLRSDTIESALASSLDSNNESACCLTRCCNFIKNQIVSFFDWLCRLFHSESATVKEEVSKPATLDAMQAAKNERQSHEEHSLGFIKNHFRDRYDNVTFGYYYFVDAIEASIKIKQIEDINDRWDKYIDLLKTGEKFEDGDIITEKRLDSDKKKALQLYDELIKQGESNSFQNENLEACKATVEDYCLGKTTIQIKGQSCSLVDLFAEGVPPVVPQSFRIKFKEIIQEIRTPVLESFKDEIETLSTDAMNRYKNITFDLIEDEAYAVNCLADAIDVIFQLDILLRGKGDISKASLAKKCKKLRETLAKPIFSQSLTNTSQLVASFACNSSGIDIVDTICSLIEENQNKDEAQRVRLRLNAVITSLQVK
jgi:hypothetical protein